MKNINIIYLLPELKGASGGAKVIYNHSIILNNLDKNITSTVIHLKKKISYKLETSISKKIKFFDKKEAGWNATKMKVSKYYLLKAVSCWRTSSKNSCFKLESWRKSPRTTEFTMLQ